MICVSLGKTTPEKIREVSSVSDLVEIRLDLNNFVLKDIKHIFRSSANLIGTFRRGTATDHERQDYLLAAKRSGAKYIDLDIHEDKDFVGRFISGKGPEGSGLILSCHNHGFTPDRKELAKTVLRMFSEGADIAKIACTVRHREDIFSLLSLYENFNNIISIGMGPEGRLTRIAACLLGAPFTYGSFGDERTETGQISSVRMKEIIQLIKNG
jgi:3-dehydroquinate dehydratase-1